MTAFKLIKWHQQIFLVKKNFCCGNSSVATDCQFFMPRARKRRVPIEASSHIAIKLVTQCLPVVTNAYKKKKQTKNLYMSKALNSSQRLNGNDIPRFWMRAGSGLGAFGGPGWVRGVRPALRLDPNWTLTIRFRWGAWPLLPQQHVINVFMNTEQSKAYFVHENSQRVVTFVGSK